MRPIRRSMHTIPLRGILLCLTASAFLTTSCALPEIGFSKNKQGAVMNGITSFAGNSGATDKRYLTTVHIRFSESKDIAPLSIDIRRDRRSFIAAKLFQSEETKTVVNFGYTSSDGPIVGCRFNWRF